MKAFDFIVLAFVGGLLALPLYVYIFEPSKPFADALALAWIVDAVVCFAALFIGICKKG